MQYQVQGENIWEQRDSSSQDTDKAGKGLCLLTNHPVTGFSFTKTIAKLPPYLILTWLSQSVLCAHSTCSLQYHPHHCLHCSHSPSLVLNPQSSLSPLSLSPHPCPHPDPSSLCCLKNPVHNSEL
jgi:hypothetical protein